MSLHAIVLAGGYGTRLMPFTERGPKHLLPIGDEPVIAHQLRRLAAAGVDDVVLATAYRAEAFRPVLAGGERFGINLRYSREETPLGTGGALAHAASELNLRPDDDLLVLNGDLLTSHDMQAQVREHRRARPRGIAVTIHARSVDDTSAFGLLHLDENDRVTRFEEKPSAGGPGLVNAGTYVVAPQVLSAITAGEVCSLEREVFPVLASEGSIGVFDQDAAFADIGTPQALLSANLEWAARHGRDSVVLTDDVAPDAQVKESLVMREGKIGRAEITRSVIGPGVRIGDGARVIDSYLGDDVIVPARAQVIGRSVPVGVSC